MNILNNPESGVFKLIFISVFPCGHGFAAGDTNGVKKAFNCR